MSQVAPDLQETVAKLAKDVTRSPNPPSPDLTRALEQLVFVVTTGEKPPQPVDWAYAVSQAVADRH